jgi:hypothetical protein
MQVQPQQPIMIQPPSTWIDQPTATIIGSAVVLLGIGVTVCIGVATLRQNRKKVRFEQLEKRAKDREQRSQDLYAEFAAAAHLLIQSYAEYGNAFALHEDFVPAIAQFDNISEDQAKTTLLTQRDDMWGHVRQHKNEMASAWSRILIDEDDPTRCAALRAMYDKVRSIDFRKIKDTHQVYVEALRSFCASIGVSLDVRYRHERDLAERGQLPSRILPQEEQSTPEPVKA